MPVIGITTYTPIACGTVGMLVFSMNITVVGVTVAVVNKAVVTATEEGVMATILVVSGAMDVSISVMIIVGVEIMTVVSGSIVGKTVDEGEIVTSMSVSFSQVHLLRLFCDASLDKLSSASSVINHP